MIKVPRVNLTQADREKAEQARKEEAFRRTIEHAMVDSGVKTKTELAGLLGITKQCLYQRMKCPCRFTWSEICKMVQLLRISNDSVLQMMGVRL